MRPLYARLGFLRRDGYAAEAGAARLRDGVWAPEPPAAPPRRPEGFVVGVAAERRGRPILLVRPPARGAADLRTVARGAECATRPRPALAAARDRLRRELGPPGAPLRAPPGRGEDDGRPQRPAPPGGRGGALCAEIAELLLELELRDRDGGRRWLYVPGDRAPTLAQWEHSNETAPGLPPTPGLPPDVADVAGEIAEETAEV